MTRTLALAMFMATALGATEFTTYIGDANEYHATRAIVDGSGNTYVTGSRTFRVFSETVRDIFVAKVDATGKVVLFTTLSGKGDDQANGIALDGAGNIYVAGATSSPNLPLRNPLQATPGPGFLVKWNPDASQVLYASYFPGAIEALAVDQAGSMYVTGFTYSPTFPVTPGLPAGHVGFGVPITGGAFITKISAAGDRIVYSTVLAGSDKNCGAGSSCFTSSRFAEGRAIALDPAGNAYIAGNTDTLNLPTTPGALFARGPGAFVAKVNAAGTALAYLTYLGQGNLVVAPYSNPANSARAITVDAAGNAYVVGSTFDPKFPATPGAFQTTYHGPSDISTPQNIPPSDAFAIKLNTTGTAAVWATYIGGGAADAANAASLDAAGNLWISGTTASTDFPNAQGWSQGGEFVVAVNPSGSALPYSGRYPNGAAAAAVSVDSTGLLRIAGETGIVSAVPAGPRPAMRAFGIANAAYGPIGGRVAPGEVISIYGPHIGPANPVSQPNVSGSVPTSLGGVQVLFDGTPAPLLYVSDSQINAVAPFGLTGQSTTRMRIVFNENTSTDFTASVIPTEPEVFQNSNGSAAAINEDGTVNSPDHPAPPGSVVSIWATGTGVPSTPPADGQIAASAQNYYCCSVFSGSTRLDVSYAGAAPGIVAGVVQINFRVPGAGDVTIGAGAGMSNAVRIY